MSSSLYEIPLNTLTGKPSSLEAYAGKVLLVVNVASKCGLTPQYEGLETLFEREREKGLVVLGFPSNQFGAQEPGSANEIAEFCSVSYGVQFPMFEKIDVNGAERHPLYRELIAARPGDITWNFEKFLVSRDGRVVERFSPATTPDDPRLVAAIERELAVTAAN